MWTVLIYGRSWDVQPKPNNQVFKTTVDRDVGYCIRLVRAIQTAESRGLCVSPIQVSLGSGCYSECHVSLDCGNGAAVCWNHCGEVASANSGLVDCTWPTHCFYLCHTHQLDAGQSHGLWMFLHVTSGKPNRMGRHIRPDRIASEISDRRYAANSKNTIGCRPEKPPRQKSQGY